MKANNKKTFAALLLWSALFSSSTPLLAFEDPTRVPSVFSQRMLSSPMTAITNAGSRLVAVGQRGHIAVSDDNGLTWQQSSSPVSSDLVAVSFADAQHGWAVGHGGMVLHSQDAGATWVTQLDGVQTATLIKSFYAQANALDGIENPEQLVEREEILESYGGTQPLMAVHFLNPQQGFIAGLFNRLLYTQDGGTTWQPWQHKIDNPGELHIYSFAQGPAGLFMTGEQGKVWRFDETQKRFTDVSTEYGGTLFGALVHNDSVWAFGMRGSLFRSDDQGHSWQRIALNSNAGITSARVLANENIILSTLAGEIYLSQDQGMSFHAQRLHNSMPYFSLAPTQDGSLALAGAQGLKRSSLNSSTMHSSDAHTLSTTALLGAEHGHRH